MVKLNNIQLPDMLKATSHKPNETSGTNQQKSSAQILAKIFSKNYSVERKANTRLIFQESKETQITKEFDLSSIKPRTTTDTPVKMINQRSNIGSRKGRETDSYSYRQQN